jgi:hypothetical protein
MADDGKVRKLKVRVVCHQYGQHFRGDLLEVEEREYRRVGTQVLLSKEDEDAQRREAEAQRTQQATALAGERQTASGWTEKEAEAARIVRARQLDEQRKQRELLVGSG